MVEAESTRPGFTVWFTGLSGTGKTTISSIVARQLRAHGRRVELLDGDELRTHLSADLGFSREDRDENIRRIGWVCQLLNRHGIDAVVAAISPYRAARDAVRAAVPAFVEVHTDAPLDVLAARDPKGLYGDAAAGKLSGLTGVDDPYEPPVAPEISLRTDGQTDPGRHAELVIDRLVSMGLLETDDGASDASEAEAPSDDAYTDEEESEVTDRLRDLGYL